MKRDELSGYTCPENDHHESDSRTQQAVQYVFDEQDLLYSQLSRNNLSLNTRVWISTHIHSSILQQDVIQGFLTETNARLKDIRHHQLNYKGALLRMHIHTRVTMDRASISSCTETILLGFGTLASLRRWCLHTGSRSVIIALTCQKSDSDCMAATSMLRPNSYSMSFTL